MLVFFLSSPWGNSGIEIRLRPESGSQTEGMGAELLNWPHSAADVCSPQLCILFTSGNADHKFQTHFHVIWHTVWRQKKSKPQHIRLLPSSKECLFRSTRSEDACGQLIIGQSWSPQQIVNWKQSDKPTKHTSKLTKNKKRNVGVIRCRWQITHPD